MERTGCGRNAILIDRTLMKLLDRKEHHSMKRPITSLKRILERAKIAAAHTGRQSTSTSNPNMTLCNAEIGESLLAKSTLISPEYLFFPLLYISPNYRSPLRHHPTSASSSITALVVVVRITWAMRCAVGAGFNFPVSCTFRF